MKMTLVPKELSWCEFNARVLEEAADRTLSLAERLVFLSIHAANIDEFFRVRVALLRRLSRIVSKKRKPEEEMSPSRILAEIRRIVAAQKARFDELYEGIFAEMADSGVLFVNDRELPEEYRGWASVYFDNEILPRLFPVIMSDKSEVSTISDAGIYLFCAVVKNHGPGRALSLVEIPSSLPRFIEVPERKGMFLYIDDMIRLGLGSLFSRFGYVAGEAYSIKIVRDAELDIDLDLSESLFQKVHKSLKKRKKGAPVRIAVDERIPLAMKRKLCECLCVEDDGIIQPGGRYHNLKDLALLPRFAALTAPEIPMSVRVPLETDESILAQCSAHDKLFTFPYHSFDAMVDMLREAAVDRTVDRIRLTLYRAAPDSRIVGALLAACRSGKDVTVIVELKARFDEEANIALAQQLSEEGARVVYGLEGLKIHAKLCLIERRIDGKRRRIACVGTGNFNELTAKRYIDHLMITADRRITSEVAELFDYLEEPYKISKFDHCIVAPFHMRKKLLKCIARETMKATKGGSARIDLRLNNLTDTDCIEKLVEAARAGVKVRVLVRSMCAIEAGRYPIEVKRVIDSYLEHARVIIFGSGDEARVFLSSADIMSRNLDRRIEVIVPVYDPACARQLMDIFELSWSDTRKGSPVGESAQQWRSNRDGVRSQYEIPRLIHKYYPGK
jgi:polyphosphate kinase